MKQLLTVFPAFFWGLIFATSALGCLCDTASFPEEFKASTAVFSARYVGEEYRKGLSSETVEMTFRSGEEKKDYEILVLKFQVEKWWKGNLKQEVILVTDRARFSDGSTMISDCELAFEKGKRYLIYAFGAVNKLQTGACSRTASFKRAKNDLRLLGKGRKPVL